PGRSLASFPKCVEGPLLVPGPCDPGDLISGVVFAANYRGCAQLLSEKSPSQSARLMQAQEAIRRVERIKVLSADTQEVLIDHPLQAVTYITDIGNLVVLMARRRVSRPDSQEDHVDTSNPLQYKMICHVFDSEDAGFIARSVGQAFSVAYQEFLRASGINPEDLSHKQYSKLLKTKDLSHHDLALFSKAENCKDVCIEKSKGEILGVVIVESGWGSILPTVIIANLMHAGPAERSRSINIGDQIMSVNSTSLDLKSESGVKLSIVSCPPVTTVLIRRPDLRHQLGFSVQNGVICSLMRGGIAERGGVRVGHRIIDINGQSVVTTPQKKMVHILSSAVGEIHMTTMPAAVYRLLTGQDQPVYI
ncbi:hypothetical protein NHX12_028523, partial [Muraenolepis orangiensis]